MNLVDIGVDILDVIEHALRNPTEKAAVQIALDGIGAVRDALALPSVQKVRADIAAYVATLPPAAKPTQIDAPADQPYVAPAHQSPSDFNNDPRNR